MADKKYTVQMDFTANTSSAQQALRGLQATLAQISSQNITPGAGMEANIKKASAAASELSIHLKNALNVNTGNIDLSKFNKSLTLSKTSLKSLMTDLVSIGPAGNQAFLELASSIAKAEAPAVRLNSLLTQTWATIKGSLRWELVTRGLTDGLSKIQEAYNYAKDLDKSLNSIRIVSGESADSMARFAKQANAAAKELRSTTLDYTDSALIYFQQGLGMSDVLERTDVTVKMANVVEESVQTVSDQLTAIWNNFDDGSKSAEYFADVLTKLGADTASSTDEIAQGLEKFASVATDVGLSYEYATAALTTITATTRQSADVVGTALKTIFSRMQGLKLGDTLDDGTTLNDYSKALLAVGVNIKDDNGELKDMDIILDEVGAKWATLGKDQRVALAQQVAGVRQYNQFISLMSNYDFFKENVQRAMDATGTLNEQNEIYKESWEAASKAVKASVQGIYDSIIDDKWIIKATNNVAEFISGIDQFIDSIGGLKTIIPAIGSIFLMMFANKIPEAIHNLGYNFDVLTGKAYKDAASVYTTTKEQIQDILDSTKQLPEAERLQYESLMQVLSIKEKIARNQKDLTDEEKKRVEAALENLGLEQSLLATLIKQGQVIQNNQDKKQTKRISQINAIQDKDFNSDNRDYASDIGQLDYQESQYNNLLEEFGEDEEIRNIVFKAKEIFATARKDLKKAGEDETRILEEGLNNIFDTYIETMSQLPKEAEKIPFKDYLNNKNSEGAFIEAEKLYGSKINSLQKISNKVISSPDELLAEATHVNTIAKSIPEIEIDIDPSSINNIQELQSIIEDIIKKIKNIPEINLQEHGIQDKNISSLGKTASDILELKEQESEIRTASEKAKDTIKNFYTEADIAAEHTVKFSEKISSLVGSTSTLAFGINSLRGALDSLTNSDLTWVERISQSFISLSSGMPMIIQGFQQLSNTIAKMKGYENLSMMAKGTVLAEDSLAGVKSIFGTLDDEDSNSVLSLIKVLSSKNSKAVNTKNADLLIAKIKELEAANKITSKSANAGIKAITQGLAGSGGVLASLGAILPYIGAIALAIGVVAGVIYLVKKHIEEVKAASPEGQYKAAQENVEMLSKSLEEATKKNKEFQDSYGGYKEAIKKIKDLKEGTEEYAAAVLDANKKAMELVETYKLYDQYYFENGIIKFKNQGDNTLEEYEKFLNENEVNLKVQKILADQKAVETELNYKIDKTLTDDGYSYAPTDYSVETLYYKDYLKKALNDLGVQNKNGNIDNNQLILKLTELLGKEVGKSITLPQNWEKIIEEYVKDWVNSNGKAIEEIKKEHAKLPKQIDVTAQAILTLISTFSKEAQEKLTVYSKENPEEVDETATQTLRTGYAYYVAQQGEINGIVAGSNNYGEKGEDLTPEDLEDYLTKLGKLEDFKFLTGEEKVNYKSIQAYYEKLYGQPAESLAQALQGIFSSLDLENTIQQLKEQGIDTSKYTELWELLGKNYETGFTETLVNTLKERKGLEDFKWEEFLPKLNLSDIVKPNGDIMTKEEILRALGIPDEIIIKIIGETPDNSTDAQEKAIEDIQEKFAKDKGITNSAEGYEKYARTVLKWDDDMIEKKKKLYGNDIVKAVLAENDAILKAANAQITLAKSLTQTSDNLDDLTKSYNNWKKTGTVDLSDFADDSKIGKMFTSFGEDGVKAFKEIQVAFTNAKTSEEVQEAYDKAATAVVNLTLKVEDLTGMEEGEAKALKESTLEKLRAMGITNAEALVESKFAEALIASTNAQAGYTEAKIETALASENTVKNLELVVSALMAEGISANTARAAMVKHATALIKTNLASGQLSLSNAISQISAVAEVASKSSIAVSGFNDILAKVKTFKTKAEIRAELIKNAPRGLGRLIDIEVNEIYNAQTSQLQNYLDKILSQIDNVNISTSYTPPATSSSSGSKDKKDKKEKTDKEFDQELTRYYKLDKLYEKASDQLDDISKAKDRAYGPKHLKYLDQEISATQKLMDINKKYLKQNVEYTKQDLANFNQTAKDMGLNFSIGSLDNLADDYETAEKLAKKYGEDITAEFNAAQAAAVDRYNASAKDTTASEQYDKDIKAAEDAFNQKSKLREEYLDYLGKLDEDAAKKREKERELIEQEISLREKRIEKITYQVEIIGDATEAKEAFLDWYKELSPYQKYRVQFEMNIDKENFRQAINDVEDYSEQLEAILKEAGINASAKDFLNGKISSSDLDKLQDQSIIDAIKEISNNLISSAQKVKESMESITQDYIDGLDRQKDKFQEFADSIDFVREGYTSLFNITELAGGWNKVNKIFDFNSRIKEAKKYLDAETDIRRSALKNQGAELQGYNEMRKQAEIDYNAALASGDAARIEETKKILDKQTELYRDAYNTWSSGFEDLLNNIFDNFSKKVELMFLAFDKQYNTIKDKFDKTKSLSEDYMDDFQKMYEVNKLNADIQKSINDTKNVKSKQELVALQNKINQKAKEQGKMSEYEVQALRKQYELKLAMQQLEDAQNAKSQVRLTRDAEGNFGYMYTADKTSIADAQQNLNDKLYEYYKFNTDRVEELSETYLDLMSQMEEEIKNLSLQDFESEAAYNQAVERIKDFYMQKMDTIKTEMEQALNNNNELTREYAEAISSLGVNFQMIIDEFKDTNLAQALGMEDSQLAFDKFNETFFGEDGLINKVKNEAAEAFRTLGESINEAATSIGGEGGLTDALKELNDEFGETAAGSLLKWAETLIETLGENSKLYKELMKTLPSLSNGLNNVNDSVKRLTGGATNAQTGAAGQGQSDYSGADGSFLSKPRLVKWAALKAAAEQLFRAGDDPLGTVSWARSIIRVATGLDPEPSEPKKTLMDITTNGTIDVADARFALRDSVGLEDFDKEHPEYLDRVWEALERAGVKFDTGGYTGAWGTSGRMAMLHEKELVLNKQDTSNLLSSVDILRGISKTLDLQAISARIASSGLISSIGISNRSPQAVQQDVHISATFPNVSDSKEIEEAFNNLVNEAVQYTTQQF